MSFAIKICTPQTDLDWQSYYELRWRLLRAPWQQPKGSEQDEWEQNAYHVMAKTIDGKALGVGRIHINEEWQIRYMAVAADHRGQGIGSRILQCLEDYAQSQGAAQITLKARESAIKFYLHHNYCVVGDAQTLFGVIKHKTMRKIL